ncbi:MAG TPA: ABC transporter permease [Thermoflexia bacterium]|jgi:spermidine/putrescine transport system permease protein|nr:ABC transporter permease [Thermoflexia bacterium]
MAERPRARRETVRLLFLIAPSLFWLLVFFLFPLLLVFAISFGQRGTYGGVRWDLTLENYVRFFDPLYLRIFGRTFSIALTTTFLCLLIGYPLAYFIATRPARWRNGLVLLLMIPFWTNFLIRTYAWLLILRDQGVINTFWTGPLHEFLVQIATALPLPLWEILLRATSQPLHLFGTDGAIIVGLVYGWLPDMVLPCYAAIERLDFSLVEAAQDLYANRFRSFTRVILPLTMPGIIAGSILVFIPSLGAYVTPDLLGGAKSIMLGNVIYSQFMSARDYPFGSAISFVLMAVMLVGTLVYFRMGAE